MYIYTYEYSCIRKLYIWYDMYRHMYTTLYNKYIHLYVLDVLYVL